MIFRYEFDLVWPKHWAWWFILTQGSFRLKVIIRTHTPDRSHYLDHYSGR